MNLPSVQSILPIPIGKGSHNEVPSGVNANMRNYGVYKNYRNQYPTYCTTLPPPPRDQIQYHKYFNQTRCAYLPPSPYQNNKCYFLESNPTGPANGRVGGYFCGGSPNLNYARGNEFGLDYPYKTPPVQDFNVSTNQPTNLDYYDVNLNLRNFKNDYDVIENNVNYKSYPFNRKNNIVYKQKLN